MEYIDSLVSAVPYGERVFFGNTVAEYAIAAIIFVLTTIIFALLQGVIIARLQALSERTATDLDDTLIEIVRGIQPSFYIVLSLFVSVNALSLPDLVSRGVQILFLIAIAFAVVQAIHKVIDYALMRRARLDSDDGAASAYEYLAMIGKWVIWILAGLAVLSNLGIDITSFIAGLGVVGIAVAFALQKILGDLFSSFAIYFDKPFRKGDFIMVGGDSGTVEHIGIKTTRLRTLQGEELVVPNEEMTSSRVQNFRKLEERRVAFSFGVLYETPLKQVEAIPDMVREIFSQVGEARLDRVHFASLGDSALLFEVVYYVESKEYVVKMDVQHKINMMLMQRFEKEKIGFAYPTQTIHIQK